MSLLLTRIRPERCELMASVVHSGQAGGLIVIGQLGWHPYLNELALQGLPMAVWGASLPDALYPQWGDNAMGGYLGTQHLIARGCRRLTFVGDPGNLEGGLRFAGHARTLTKAGLSPDPALLVPYRFGDTQLREQIEVWLDGPRSPAAMWRRSP